MLVISAIYLELSEEKQYNNMLPVGFQAFE